MDFIVIERALLIAIACGSILCLIVAVAIGCEVVQSIYERKSKG